MTSLELRQEGSRIVYDLAIAGRPNKLAEGEYVVLFLDADNDAATGDGGSGADYLIEFEQKGKGVLRIYRYDSIKKTFAFDKSFNASFRTLWGGRLASPPNVWRFYFSPSMFGIGASFRFYARAESSGPGKDYIFDRVPDPGLTTFVLADRIAPRVKALPSTGERASVAKLRYRVSDSSGRTRETVTVTRGAKMLAKMRTSLHPAVAGRVRSVGWKVPASIRGVLRFCVQAFDVAGNASPSSCARLVVR